MRRTWRAPVVKRFSPRCWSRCPNALPTPSTGPPQHAAPDQLKGNPGSRGQASGLAHVARTLDEAKELQPGEILVAVTTMPAWTPLFGVAAAIVTETGGSLCHGAIVAREYGIPAVVGAAGATQAIRSGHWITVDGTTGLVTIATN